MPPIYSTSLSNSAPQPTNGDIMQWEGPAGDAVQPLIQTIITDLNNICSQLNRSATGAYGGGLTSDSLANNSVLSRNLKLTNQRVFFPNSLYTLGPGETVEYQFKNKSTTFTPDFVFTAESGDEIVKVDFNADWGIFTEANPTNAQDLYYFRLLRATSPDGSGGLSALPIGSQPGYTAHTYSKNFRNDAFQSEKWSMFWCDTDPKTPGTTYYYFLTVQGKALVGNSGKLKLAPSDSQAFFIVY